MVSLSVPSITGHHSPRHNHPSHNRPPVYDIIISQTQSLFVPRSTQIHNHETISNPVTMLPDKVTSKQHSEDTTQNDVISIDFPAPSGWTKREVKNTVQVLEDVKGIPDLTNSSLIEGRWRLMFTTRSGTASPIQNLIVDLVRIVEAKPTICTFKIVDLVRIVEAKPTIGTFK